MKIRRIKVSSWIKVITFSSILNIIISVFAGMINLENSETLQIVGVYSTYIFIYMITGIGVLIISGALLQLFNFVFRIPNIKEIQKYCLLVIFPLQLVSLPIALGKSGLGLLVLPILSASFFVVYMAKLSKSKSNIKKTLLVLIATFLWFLGCIMLSFLSMLIFAYISKWITSAVVLLR